MNAPRESKKTAREKAAAARAQALAEEKRRERMVRIVGSIAVLLVVGGIIGVAVVATRGSSDSGGGDASSSATPDPSAPLPKGVLDGASEVAPYGVPYGTAPATAPVLELWEDFQCPACGQLEREAGASIEKLAEDGKVQLVWRPTTFLDNNLNNDASKRAAAAWGCAIDGGVTREYHNTVFANQPTTEGDGWTDEQLLQFGKDSGLEGEAYTAFEKCYTDRTYVGWAVNSTDVFYSSNIPGTPNAILNGTELPTATLLDPAELEKAITEAAQQ
ncbi:MAG: thioredoxin domain-containing protein [Candidatus Nanopelagicales bacterium]